MSNMTDQPTLSDILSDINVTVADLETFAQRTIGLTTDEQNSLKRAIGQAKASRASVITALRTLQVKEVVR